MKKILKLLHSNKQGLTSIELVVVFAIFAALASSVLFGYREFSTNIKLQNLAQDVALQIRQAQNRAVSGSFPLLNDQQVGPSLNWAPSYGIYFSAESGQNQEFKLFFDDNQKAVVNPIILGNHIMDGECGGGPQSECFDIVQITNGEIIQSICLNEVTTGTCDSVDNVYITFTRPLNRATILVNDESIPASDVSIYLRSTTESPAIVRVMAAGQIIVE